MHVQLTNAWYIKLTNLKIIIIKIIIINIIFVLIER